MQGIHPDCHIEFITPATTALKLPIVVREEALHYLESLSGSKIPQEQLAFTQLLNQIEDKGIEIIWDKINGRVIERLFDEFGSLYHEKIPSFLELVNTGQFTELTDGINHFREIQNTNCNHQALSSNTFFYQRNILLIIALTERL